MKDRFWELCSTDVCFKTDTELSLFISSKETLLHSSCNHLLTSDPQIPLLGSFQDDWGETAVNGQRAGAAGNEEAGKAGSGPLYPCIDVVLILHKALLFTEDVKGPPQSYRSPEQNTSS